MPLRIVTWCARTRRSTRAPISTVGISDALVGDVARPLSWTLRGVFALAGLLLMIPAGVAWWGPWTDIVGFALAVVAVGREVITMRRLREA
jgi:hypothetical protein